MRWLLFGQRMSMWTIADPVRSPFVRSLEEDLKRRDFTVKCLCPGRDRRNHWLVPWFRRFGKSKSYEQLEWVSERFNEDALRIMRGFRFRPVLALSLSQKRLKLWRLWRHFWRKFLWSVPSLSLINSCWLHFGEGAWLPWLRVNLWLSPWYGS